MKLHLILSLLLSLLWTGAAHSEPAANEELLAQLTARSKAIQAVEGQFEQHKTIAVLPVPLASNGRFAFEQGKKVVWETLMPIQSRLELTPGGISFSDASGAQSHQAGAQIVAKIFMGVIAGELDSLQDYFSLSASGTAGDWHIQMVPRSANLAAYITRIDLRGGEFTEHLDIAEANGDKTAIVFTTQKLVRAAQ